MVKTRAQQRLSQSTSNLPSLLSSEAVPPPAQIISREQMQVSSTHFESGSRAHTITSRSSRSSATIISKKLAAEAQHARHLAQIAEMEATIRTNQLELERKDARHLAQIAEMEATIRTNQLELERKAAEAEYKAELAAIDADNSSHGSHSERSRASVEQWLHSTALPPTIPKHHDREPPIKGFSSEDGCQVGLNKKAFLSSQGPALCNDVVDSPNVAVPSSTSLPQHNIRGGGRATATDVQREDGSIGVTQLVQALQTLNKNNSCNKNIIKLPVFDGKSPLDWLMFKRAFQDTLGKFTEAENLARLNQVLKGAAREAVSMLLVMSDKASDVIDALDQRFGRPEQIVLQEVNAVRALPKLGPEVRDLNIFATRVRNCVQVVKLLHHSDYLRSPELFGALLSKLSPLLRTRWLDFAASHECVGQARVETLSLFLNHEVNLVLKFGAVAEATSSPSYHQHRAHTVSESDNSFIRKTFKPQTTKFSVNKNHHCSFCKQSHQLSDCQKFKSLTVDDKWLFVKDNKVCHRCLKKDPHSFKFCNRNKAGCIVADCNRKHHSLLHNINFVPSIHVNNQTEPIPSVHVNEQTEPVPTTTTNTEQIHVANNNSSVNPSVRPLLKVIAVTVSGPAGSFDTFALLDDGSTATFIDSDVASQIGAEGPEGRLHLDCVGGLSKDSACQYVDFEIKGRASLQNFLIRNARSIKNLGLLSQSASRDNLHTYTYLSDLVNELSYDQAKPTLIIGLDNWHLMCASETRKGLKSQPVAIRTPLGWVLFGFFSSRTKLVQTTYHVSLREKSDPQCDLEVLIKEQYRLDAIGITKHEPRNSADQRALHILESTSQRLANGHFQVGLLWKADNLVVPSSYPLAFSRFRNLESKMSRDPEYAKRYRLNIKDMLSKGYAEECTGQTPQSILWYLPHFGVVNPNKPGKLRVVHDAAAKIQGVSLNSLLLLGPDFLQPLLGILMRFREGRIAMTADIKEMFPQVKIKESDRDAQRFLWRDDPSDPVKTYRMSSMIFGACSSPSTAIYIVNRNASEFRGEFPEAVHSIITDTYMDDYICSLDVSIEHATRLASEVVEVHKRGGFEMRGWISNQQSALSRLPRDLLSDLSLIDNSIDLGSLHSSTFTRTLGLVWQPSQDVIGFNIGLKNHSPGHHFTKREVLAQVMRIYDPLGILAPIVVRGRILFQNLWRKKLDWDDRLPETDQATWMDWFESLKSISKLKIPRCYNLSSYIELELHMFCDASEQAHAAVAFWRFILSNGEPKLALIASKARVSPLKPVSIPRLELQSALIATRLAVKICEAHRFKPSRRIFWCDSMVVLGWLRSDGRNYKPFVAHRIGEILESTSQTDWHWVPSELNVADDATREKSLADHFWHRWLLGPTFLLTPSCEWPSEAKSSVAATSSLGQEEMKSSHHNECTIENINFTNSHQLPLPVVADITHFSSWIRLVRATARTHQFIASIFLNRGHNYQNLWVRDICSSIRIESNSRGISVSATAPAPLDAEDIIRAERHILGWSQLSTFGKELQCLTSGQHIPKKSRLAILSPVLENGLLYLAGRTSAASHERPIILDGKEPAVRLLIYHYHIKFAHANTESVINELRQQFWIIGLRNAVRSVVHRCQMCKLLKSPTLQPPMADLPDARLAHNRRPFTFTGIDYFGHVEVTVGRRREKRWVALFTCMVTRAVHLEIVASLSSDSAIMCLRRFIARRGTPSQLFSDNGTSFVGANRQLRTFYDAAVTEFAAEEKIIWKFIPPSAPFMGGAWERLVRSVKTALKVILRERAPREEVLSTLLTEAESIVNSRPLTHISPDPDYPEALTPNHFLLGNSSGQPLPSGNLTDAALIGRSSWQKAVRLADHFWRRWVAEYLPTLAPRRVPGADVAVKIGDPVLIGDGDLPRGFWPRGVITALFPGRDGVVRVVEVRTKGDILRRPLKKIVLLR